MYTYNTELVARCRGEAWTTKKSQKSRRKIYVFRKWDRGGLGTPPAQACFQPFIQLWGAGVLQFLPRFSDRTPSGKTTPAYKFGAYKKDNRALNITNTISHGRIEKIKNNLFSGLMKNRSFETE